VLNQRRGFSLVEVILVVGVIGLLLALLVPAVFKVRQAAARSAGTNQSRQIVLAILNFAAAHNSRLPSLDGARSSANPSWAMFQALLPFAGFEAEWNKTRTEGGAFAIGISLYLGTNDPTLTPAVRGQQEIDYCSYAANAQVFLGNPSISQIGDGLSNTIGLAEHYARINRAAEPQSLLVDYKYTQGEIPTIHPKDVPPKTMVAVQKRPSFADQAWGDVIPVTAGGATTGSTPRLTFEAAPLPTKAIPWIAQSPYHKCMIVSLLDGSTRTISVAMREHVYWSLVTPNGNEPVFPE
jgi:prepilin-type N-terminal cleavage/methylation domain-containing protein